MSRLPFAAITLSLLCCIVIAPAAAGCWKIQLSEKAASDAKTPAKIITKVTELIGGDPRVIIDNSHLRTEGYTLVNCPHEHDKKIQEYIERVALGTGVGAAIGGISAGVAAVGTAIITDGATSCSIPEAVLFGTLEGATAGCLTAATTDVPCTIL